VDAEFVECPPGGRRVVRTRPVRLADVTPTGRLRLDALARYLQDIAADDVDDAGIRGAWVVRRTALRVGDLPTFREVVELDTFCSGTGGRVAERRTSVRLDGEVRVEATAIWVHIDDAGRPAALKDWFWDLYGTAANGRRVSGRLRLPPPPADTSRRPWPTRHTDLDVLGHVNNSIAWAALEDELARTRPNGDGRIVAAEMEYRAPIDIGDECELRTAPTSDGLACWLVVDDEVRTAVSAVLASRAPA
jgi:acyl-ACP thioesterase